MTRVTNPGYVRPQNRPIPLCMKRTDEVERQLIATLFDQRGVLIAGHAALFLVAIAGWFESGQSWFPAWAAAIVVVLAVRLRYERHFHPARHRCNVGTSRLIHRIGCWATGGLLGCAAFVIVNHVDPVIQLLVLAAETVFIMGGAARNAASRLNAKGQILLGIVPVFAACLLTADAAYMLLSLAILFELASAFMLVDYLNARLVRLLVVVEENSTLIGQLEHSATTDSLTGIANRRRFDTVLSDETRRAERDGAYLAVLLLDVDFFKRYNDRYGHPAGDECLQRVAAVLAASLNRTGDLVARYGGEEFVAVLPALRSGASDDARRNRARERRRARDPARVRHRGHRDDQHRRRVDVAGPPASARRFRARGRCRALHGETCRPELHSCDTRTRCRSELTLVTGSRFARAACVVQISALALAIPAQSAAAPDHARTPGAIATTDTAVVCKEGYAHGARHVPYRVRDSVYAAYGIPRGHRSSDGGYVGPRRGYVIDHLVPLELGGANDARNLWPQPRTEARRKDRVEDALHDAVCAGRMRLVDAQARIERDWQHALP